MIQITRRRKFLPMLNLVPGFYYAGSNLSGNLTSPYRVIYLRHTREAA